MGAAGQLNHPAAPAGAVQQNIQKVLPRLVPQGVEQLLAVPELRLQACQFLLHVFQITHLRPARAPVRLLLECVRSKAAKRFIQRTLL